MAFEPTSWVLRSHALDNAGHTLIMGVVNVTPDSFSDGAAFVDDAGSVDHDAAVRHGLRLWEAGADIIDVGGESTRPGSSGVPEEVEWERAVPVVAGLAAAGALVSIDTTKPRVAEAAIASGAEAVNDITALRDPDMAAMCARARVGVVLTHMQGAPATMQDDPHYGDVVVEVGDELASRAAAARDARVRAESICLDPGIGFGKTFQHNLELLDRLDDLVQASPYPVMVGTSRKGFLGRILEEADRPAVAADRDPATAATVALAIAKGAFMVRVHNVADSLQSARAADAIVRRGHS